MKTLLVWALCALFCLSVRANPVDQSLRSLLEKLETFVEENNGESKLGDVFNKLTGNNNLLKRAKPYDDYDPSTLELLPPNYEAELTSQDYEDMDIEEIDDDVLAALETDYTTTTSEITTLRNEEPTEEEKREMRGNDVLLKENIKRLDDTLVGGPAKSRSKRFATAILFAITVGSNSYQIYNVATAGCGTFQSICDDKDAIVSMTIEIETLKAVFDAQFQEALEDYINLRDAMYDNDFILYYTNQTINSVKNLEQMYIDIQDNLNARLPTISQMAANGSMTSEQYLDEVIGTMELSMEQMGEMIKKTQQMGAMVVAINLGAQMFFSYAASSYKQAADYYRVPEDGRLSNVANLERTLTAKEKQVLGLGNTADNVEYNSMRAKAGAKIKGGFMSLASYLPDRRVVKGMFYNMATRPFVYVSGGIRRAGGIANYFSPRRAFNNFLGYTYRKFSGGLASMRNGFQRLRSGQWRPFSTANFKFSWSTTLSFGLQAGLDIMTAVMSYYDWKRVAEEMTKQRGLYENYLTDLRNQQIELDTEMANMQTTWTETIDNFVELSEAFAEIVANGTEHSEVVDATEIGFHYDLDNPIFSDSFFTGITKDNLKEKAASCIAYINSVQLDFFGAEELLRGRVLFYNKVAEDYGTDESVADITTITRAILQSQPANEIIEFGNTVEAQDVVCYIAVVYHVDGNYYDSYELAPMLPVCDITSDEWMDMETAASEHRNNLFMVSIITSEMESDVVVATILDTVKRDFLRQSDADMQAYGTALTSKDILCAIASIDESATYYDFYELSVYRVDDCSTVTGYEHAAAEAAADQSRLKVTQVANDLNYCDSFNLCFCMEGPGGLSMRYGVSLDELKALMRAADPGRTQYCGGAPIYGIVCVPPCYDL